MIRGVIFLSMLIVMFPIAREYGLLTAMLGHAVYDVIALSLTCFTNISERSLAFYERHMKEE